MDDEQGERSFTVSDKRFSARRESEDRPGERARADRYRGGTAKRATASGQ